ncbi:MAG: NAD(+)/NADH kinase [Chloroflexi bacterium]|nr:NAD(+)/NADH kinase [Chloroflexota bacterium]
MASVALVYQPVVEEATALAQMCARTVERLGFEPIFLSSRELDNVAPIGSASFVITFGGDGTILRVARWVAGHDVPILGVQMGRLGFLAEVQPADAAEKLEAYLGGDYWVDRRAMLRAEIVPSSLASRGGDGPDQSGPNVHLKQTFLALNDVVVGRGRALRTVGVDLALNGQSLHEFRGDGVIVATATGSTAYSFASGGPVLAPDSGDLVVTPICAHLSTLRSFVVPGEVPVRLEVHATDLPQLSVDGQIELGLPDFAAVEARVDSVVTLFARQGTPEALYRRILSKLG